MVSGTSARRADSREAFWEEIVALRVLSAEGILGTVWCRYEGLVVGWRSRVRARTWLWRCVERRALMRGM